MKVDLNLIILLSIGLGLYLFVELLALWLFDGCLMVKLEDVFFFFFFFVCV